MIKDEKYIKIISNPAVKPQSVAVAEGVVINNQDITITANGVYRAAEGYTGIGTATVNVPQEATLITKNITANGTYNASSDEADGYSSVVVDVPTGTEPVINALSITPTTSSQTITPESGVDGFAPVNVAAVTAAIDSNIVAGNIKSGVNILGVAGSVVELDGETVTITPSTSQQTITPTSPHNGITSATVSAVTSAIDSNIVAGNIKKNVSILGVIGTYEGGGSSPTNFVAKKISNGVLVSNGDYGIIDLNGATTLGPGALAYAYYGASLPANTKVDLSGLSSLTNTNSLYNAFANTTGITEVDLSGLTSITGQYVLDSAFYTCSDLVSVDLSGLITINAQCLRSAFSNCSNLTSININSLTEINSPQAMSSFCSGCTSLRSVTFTSLTKIDGSQRLYAAFQRCSNLSISFPALTSSSFGTATNQFNTMLQSASDCTVHFPSNLQSVIGSWSDVMAGFSGTNTTILYDLPATE